LVDDGGGDVTLLLTIVPHDVVVRPVVIVIPVIVDANGGGRIW